jgi:hypothetical protein
MDRERLLREGGALEDVLFHATPEDLARLDGETALRLVNWSPDHEGWRIWPEVVWEVLEPGPELPAAAPEESEPANRSKRGRPPSPWWPDFAAALAMWVHLNGIPETQAELENAMLQWFTDHGYEKVGRETIRPTISRLMQLFREEQARA